MLFQDKTIIIYFQYVRIYTVYVINIILYRGAKMKISGFTFIKNGQKLYIPTKQAIESILPICDEFIIAVGDNDPDDDTLNIIESIKSDKIQIINTCWDTNTFKKNTEFARQTDIAREACSGDWLFYIQCDEAVHENALPVIRQACEDELNNPEVEGFLFKYLHFWGDYQHHQNSHAWYRREIRVIRNLPDVHSWKDAQSFRRYDSWTESYEDYQRKSGTHKLRVKLLDVYVYHYGFVRPPAVMSSKGKTSHKSYHGEEKGEKLTQHLGERFDYGPLNKLVRFEGEHPAVMKDWIAKFDWQSDLQQSGKSATNRPPHKHERLKYKILSAIENVLLDHDSIGGFKNYKLIK